MDQLLLVIFIHLIPQTIPDINWAASDHEPIRQAV
jgi:hypothetical protein